MAAQLGPTGERYQIRGQLGAGGMGVVFTALDRLAGREVALKRVRADQTVANAPGDGSDAEFDLLALAQEFRILASLRHPNIVSVLDYGFDQHRQPFFTMELLAGAQTILDAGRGLPLGSRAELLIQALQALSYLHRHGILHHDLKPANVLVADERLRLLDFGLAVSSEQPRDDDSFGTLRYLPPEVLAGEPFGRSADLYALGVIAYELLAGRHPFDAPTYEELLERVIAAQPDLAGLRLPPELQSWLARMLAGEPELRYADADAAAADLRAAAGLAPEPERETVRESFLRAARLVGRDGELAQLRAALDALAAGRGGIWLIGGESGVGKSRLLDELRIQAVTRGLLVLRGQGVEGGGLPYQLWREPLRHLALAAQPDDQAAGVLGDLVPDIEALMGRSIPDAHTLTGASWRMRMALTIVGLLHGLADPPVLLLEDLHWADESLALLRDVVGFTSDARTLVVASYRDDERPGLPEVLPGAHVLRLGRLNGGSIAVLSEAMLGPAGRSPELVALLERETEGNALFVVETMRALADEAGGLEDIGAMALPAGVAAGGVREVLLRRLRRVPAAAQPLLKLAAVAGRQLDLDVLRRLAPPPHELDGWLRACAGAAVVEVSETGWRFTHDQLRAAQLDALAPEERPLLHRRVAEAVEATYAEPLLRTVYAEPLLEHWAQAADTRRELTYLIHVAEQQITLSANYTRADALLQRGAERLAAGGLDAPETRAALLSAYPDNWYTVGYEHRDSSEAHTRSYPE